MKQSEFIEAAKAHVEAGWCKHVAFGRDNTVCLIGALEKVWMARQSPAAGLYQDSFYALEAEMCEFTGHRFKHIATFNDDDTTTKQDVIALCEKTIAKLQERGE